MSTIFVFGATSAIAMAIQRQLVDPDAHFYLVARDKDRLQSVADDLVVRGASACFTYSLDITATEKYESLLADVLIKLGAIDIAILAHGTLTDQQRAQQDMPYLLQEMQINSIGTITLAGMLANILEKQHLGTLCVISSVAGDRGRKSNYVYGSAKASVSVFLQGLRNRLFPHVNVLTVKPGFVITPMTSTMKKGLLWVQPEIVAKDVCRAIHKKKDVLYTPWFWQWIMLIIKLIPERIFKRMSL